MIPINLDMVVDILVGTGKGVSRIAHSVKQFNERIEILKKLNDIEEEFSSINI